MHDQIGSLPPQVGSAGSFALAGKRIGRVLLSDASVDWADSHEASGKSLLNVADTSTVRSPKLRGFCRIFFLPQGCTIECEMVTKNDRRRDFVWENPLENATRTDQVRVAIFVA